MVVSNLLILLTTLIIISYESIKEYKSLLIIDVPNFILIRLIVVFFLFLSNLIELR